MSRRRELPIGRIVLFALGGIVCLGLLALLAALVLFDPNAYRPQIAAAVKRATGRDLTISGPIGLAVGLTPVLTLNDIVLANLPDGSQTEMASVRRAEADIALLPLLSRQVVITRLVLVQPKLLLERGSSGRANWQFQRPASAATPGAAAPADGPAETTAGPISVRTVLVRDGEVRWRSSQQAEVNTLAIGRLDATLGAGDDPVAARADVVADGIAARVDLATGPLAQLRAPAPGATWPVRATMTSSVGRLAVAGTLARPTELAGYTLAIEGASSDLAALRPLLPARVPPLHDATWSATVRDERGTPIWSALRLHAGRSSLESLVPGTVLDRLEASADGISKPLHIDGGGSYRTVPLTLAGDLPSIAALAQTDRAGPFPFNLTGSVAAGKLAAKGQFGSLADLSGLTMSLSARLPDLAALTRLGDVTLPPFRDVAFDGQVSDAGGGLLDGVKLAGATLATSQGDLAGDATIRFSGGGAGRPSVVAQLTSKRIDVDALVATLDPPSQNRPPPPARLSPAPTSPAPTSPTALGDVGVPPPPPLPRLIIPARQIHLDFLQRIDLDIYAQAALLHALGMDDRDVAAHLIVRKGKLTLDPFSAHTPGGPLAGTLGIDGSAPDNPLALRLHAPSVELKPLMAAFGQPDDLDGTAELDIDLRGSSRSPHDLAATADGRLMFAMVDGDIDNALLARGVGELMHMAHPGGLAASGRTRLRCLAARVDLAHGTATIGTFLLDSSRLELTGSGVATMDDEMLSLHVRPLLRMGGPGISVPVRIGGMLGAPKVAIDAAGAAESVFARAGAQRLPAGEPPGDPCPAALASARDGRPGPMPAEPAAAAASAAPAKPPNAAQLLRGLIR